jgi:phosphoribosylamine--glycine ligase
MKVLVIGSGGREHALAWKLERSPSVDELISAPGSPGMASLGKTFPVGVEDLEGLAQLATEEAIDLTVVGPEIPLVDGVADVFASKGLTVFGPSKAAAEIEGSKVFCRELARRNGVPMAEGETFDDAEAAIDYSRTIAPPVVVKAEGLAAGKGVLICRDHKDAKAAIEQIMRERVFGESGNRVVVEEFLEGRETSIFCLTDGETKLILEPAQDYKRALDGDKGLNTGGMGSYSPVPWLEKESREQAVREIVLPLIDGLASEGRTYRGCFYLGAMFTAKGPRLIEVNCRFGDPETQALMPRLNNDLGQVLLACASGELKDVTLDWNDEPCVSVVVASGGYPESYKKGLPIRGIEDAEATDGVAVFHAGTSTKDGTLVNAGGRVLNVSALGPSIPAARQRAYEAVEKIEMDGKHFRRDIAEGVA